MSCQRGKPESWNNPNSTFSPGSSSSTPRSLRQRPGTEFLTPLRPQRLFAPGETDLPGYLGTLKSPTERYSEVPLSYYYQHLPLSSQKHSFQFSPKPQIQAQAPVLKRKIVYESNIVEDSRPPQSYSNRSPNWRPAHAEQSMHQPDAQTTFIKYPPVSAYNSRPNAMLPQHSPRSPPRYPEPEEYETTKRRVLTEPPEFRKYPWEIPRKSEKSGGCSGGCSGGKGKSDKIYNDYVASVRTIVISAVVRRKRIRNAVEQSITFKRGELDCIEKRAQDKATNQMEHNFRAEIISIYNDLMNRRKQLHHEMNPGKNSRGSLVSINAPTHKSTMFSTPLNQTELKESETDIANEFTKIVIETINEFSTKDIELTDEFTSLTETDIDSDAMSTYHQEYVKIIDQMEEEFINMWEQYEVKKCSCKPDDELNELMLNMGLALQEILAKQFQMCERLERKLEDECTECQSTQSKSFQNSDRLELNNVNVDIMNDLWHAMESTRQLLEERFSNSTSENYDAIFRALLAIYRNCVEQTKAMLDTHYEKRRIHEVENLSSIFVDEWTRFRKETREEFNSFIKSLNPTNMSCQEKKLKKVQEEEKAALLNKYRCGTGSKPCQNKETSAEMTEELSELEKTHAEQLDSLLWSKLQQKAEAIERIYPKESKDQCMQTCANSKQTENSWDVDSNACACDNSTPEEQRFADNKTDASDNSIDYQNLTKTTSDSKVKCTKESNESDLPDMNELTDIEVQEMKELQKNLRQWQMARRNLLESISRGLKKKASSLESTNQ